MSRGADKRVPGETQVYVRRRGRMTVAQSRALEALSERYCLPLP